MEKKQANNSKIKYTLLSILLDRLQLTGQIF